MRSRPACRAAHRGGAVRAGDLAESFAAHMRPSKRPRNILPPSLTQKTRPRGAEAVVSGPSRQ